MQMLQWRGQRESSQKMQTDMQGERQEPLKKPPVGGKSCECEREAAVIVVKVEGENGMVEMPMEVAYIDGMAVLNWKSAMRAQ